MKFLGKGKNMQTIRYLVRIFFKATKGFISDDCFYKASALTFYTLLSIVPVLAVAFGIAKGFGFEIYLENEIKAHFLEQPELAQQIIDFAYSTLAHAHGGVIATIGVISLLWTSIQLFSNIEHSLNVIWDVKSHRSIIRQICDYLTLLICFPIVVVLSSSLLVSTIAKLSKATSEISLLHAISPYLSFGLHIIPLMINWLLFSFIYLFIPNTKVHWKNAFMAGIVAGTAYHVVEWIYIHFQIGVASYGAIYGSLAALPLFLVWVNISWTLVLFGAEVAYQLEISPRKSELSGLSITKKGVGFLIATYCAQAFMKGKSPVSEDQISQDTGVSLRIVRRITEEFCNAGLLIQDKRNGFVIARNPADIKIKDLMDALEDRKENIPVKATLENTHSLAILQSYDEAMSTHEANKNLLDVIK